METRYLVLDTVLVIKELVWNLCGTLMSMVVDVVLVLRAALGKPLFLVLHCIVKRSDMSGL
jgi:hypothetical protein